MASKKRATMRGFGDPDSHVGEIVKVPEASVEAPAVLESKAVVVGASIPPPSGIEVEYVKEEGTPALLTGPWRAVEIWTQNRVYGLDASMVCRHVLDRTTGETDREHAAIGSRLLGGQVRGDDGKILSVSHPLPGLGAAAFFADGIGKRLKVSETSPVTRVLFRQRIVLVGGEHPPGWDHVIGDG